MLAEVSLESFQSPFRKGCSAFGHVPSPSYFASVSCDAASDNVLRLLSEIHPAAPFVFYGAGSALAERRVFTDAPAKMFHGTGFIPPAL